MQGATVPLARSPLDASFQHMEDDELAREARAYNRLWVQEGRFPQIAFPIPGPFKRCGPQMCICTSWPRIGKTLMQEGAVDEHDPRSLQVLVPAGTRHQLAQFLMIAWEGALSRLLIRGGVPCQYPHLARLNTDFLSFVIPTGEKHDAIRAVYAAPADSEHIRRLNYEGQLAAGAAQYLDDLRARHQATEHFSTDVALTIGRATVTAAMARLFGLPQELLGRLVDLSRHMDNTVIPRASHRQLQEADQAVAQACALVAAAIEQTDLVAEGVLAQEYRRLVTEGTYTPEQWAYIALMLIRVSIENQTDAVNLVLRRFAGLGKEARAALRGSGPVEEFTRQTMRVDPPVGFVMRWLPRTFTFETPVQGKKLVLPRGSFVLFVPRLLQSDQLDDNCGDYLLTFGYGRDMVCPGRQLGMLTVSICCREIFSRFDLTLHERPRTAENAFFRRILSGPGEVAILDRVAQGPATARA
jgi:cytochrome P450